MSLRCFLISGELSGDTHGAALMDSLRQQEPGIAFSGLGGPQMQATGGNTIDNWINEAAVVGLWEVLKKYGYFKKRFAQTLEAIDQFTPDVVVLIDYPGFNLRMAKALRERGYQGKIAYYISPQVWAWNRRRIPFMARLLDLMICIFPFEKALYEDSGLHTVFAGNPLVDELSKVPRLPREENLLGLFPGSREREVRKLFPLMLETAKQLLTTFPKLEVASAAANEALAQTMQEMAKEADVPLFLTVGNAHALMQRATCGVVASGTATLEAAWFGLPYCLVYRVAWPTYAIGKALVKVDFLGIVNILAGREVVKELLQHEANPPALVSELTRLLESPDTRCALQGELAEVVSRLGQPGSHKRAALAILELSPPQNG